MNNFVRVNSFLFLHKMPFAGGGCGWWLLKTAPLVRRYMISCLTIISDSLNITENYVSWQRFLGQHVYMGYD